MARRRQFWRFLRLSFFVGICGLLGYLALVLPAQAREAQVVTEAREAGQDEQFVYPKFTTADTATLSLVGHASIPANDTVVRLTSSNPCCQAGAVWYRTKQQVGNGFDTSFDFQVANLQGGGADGLAFVIHNDSDGLQTVGNGGCSMGYGGISKAVVIEFDTFQNNVNNGYCAENQDPNGNHIGIVSGGTGVVEPRHTSTYGLAARNLPTSMNLKQGFHTARIRYVEEGSATGVLEVYINDLVTPFLTTTLDLDTKIGLTTGEAWVGLVAGTGTTLATHDVANWVFVDSWGLSCLEYDFTQDTNAAHTFIPDPYNTSPRSADWPLQGNGWGSVNGSLSISRGVINGTPAFQGDDPIDQRLLTILREQQVPVETVSVHFTWYTVDGRNVSASDTIAISFGVRTPTHTLQGQHVFTRSQLSFDRRSRFFTAQVPLNELEIPNANDPVGLYIKLDSSNDSHVIRLKRAGVCFDAGVPDRPYVVPPGAIKACNDLKANLQARSQPFGPTAGQGEQPEFPFAQTSDVELEPYPYSIDTNGYPDLMRYGDLPPGHAAVACVFTQNGEIYNPVNPTTPVIRFTSIGTNQHWRESLTLLNYAAFFSQALKNWCANGDNVFPNIYARAEPTNYTAGYNVPPPRYTCTADGFLYGGMNNGPCGTFVGGLYRAMGYFNVDAFAAQVNHTNTPSVIGNLYYGPIAYNRYTLSNNAYSNVQQPLVRVNTANPQVYQAVPVTFEGIRIYPHLNGNRIYGNGFNAYQISWGWWWNPGVASETPIAEIVASPRDKTPTANPQGVYQAIKPGDIVITVVENYGAEAVPSSDIDLHISIVVGWGPQQFNSGAWMGYNLYPTYSSIPSDIRSGYVPYIMDRFSTPGTGDTAGPRPFNYRISHTASDIWVSSYNMPILPVASNERPQTASTPQIVAQPQVTNGITPTVQQRPEQANITWNPSADSLIIGGTWGTRATSSTLDTLALWPDATRSVVKVAWNHAGTFVASAEAAQNVAIRDAEGNIKVYLKAHESMPTTLTWNPTDSLLATADRAGFIGLWNTTSWQIERTLAYTGSSFIQNLAWNSDGSLLAGNDYQYIWIWNAATGDVERMLELTTSPHDSLQWAANDQAFMIAGGIRINAETGFEEGFAQPCSAGTDTLALLSSDETRLLGAGGSVNGFEACIHTLNESLDISSTVYLQTPLQFEPITAAAWSPDRQQVALITDHGWTSIWDSATGEVMRVAARPGATIADIQERVMICVSDDAAQLALLYQIDQGDYAQFVAEVEAHAAEIELGCQKYLITLGDYLATNPPVIDVEPQTPQDPTVASWCQPNVNEYLWTIRNPNSFDIVIGWGWADQAPDLEQNWIVVPAARDGQAGLWQLRTPQNASELRIVSGDIELSTSWNSSSCQQLTLPVVRR